MATILLFQISSCTALLGGEDSSDSDVAILAALAALSGGISIGGTTTGDLTGSYGLRLSNGGTTTNVAVSTLGAFVLARNVTSGSSYSVIFTSQPNFVAPSTCSVANTRRCTIANNTGTVGSSSVTNVAVTCATISPGNCNAVQDGFETATDCGGTTAALCPTGRACVAGTDCQSLTCTGSICQ
ncbi:MAG: hypothetical protein K1X75_02955 [Leptospirales bacterium]|nr:hypothetical protein [Leptospirales bacterium]